MILQRILKEAFEYRQEGRKFLAVFDLDSTLYDLTLRVASIVSVFHDDPAQIAKYPAECEKLKSVQIRSTDWGLEEPLARVGLESTTPFFKALFQHWSDCFFGNDYLGHDSPFPGAVEYVQELYQAGAELMYLTGRDEPRMGSGTAESLRLHRFPLAPPTARLVCKPDAKLDDAQFKLEVLREAQASYDRIWLFENEPVNLNLVARELPEIGLVFIDSVHSGRETLTSELEVIRHFQRGK